MAWCYGLPFDPALLELAAQPTLRVIVVEPDPALALPLPDMKSPNYWAVWRQDQANAASAAWIDMAAKLTALKGQVIIHAPDPNQSRQLAVRAAIKRHLGVAAPRRAVRRPDQVDAAVILIDQPDRWPDGQIASLSAQTVIVVLPKEQEYRWQVEQDDRRKVQLKAWAGSRHLQEMMQVGVPNSSGTEARIDWPSLRHLPPSGTVLTTREDILLQAAVWYQLALSKKGVLPEALSNHTATWKSYFPAANCPPAQAAGNVQARLSAAAADLPTQVMARMLLDLQYRDEDRPSALRFELTDQLQVVYTGV